MSGIDRKPVYTHRDLADFDPARQLGRPGEYPFTRGIHPTMYRGRLWTMRQFSGFGTAEDTNGRYKFLRFRTRQGGRWALFRFLYPDGGVDYHDLLLTRGADGTVRASDVLGNAATGRASLP